MVEQLASSTYAVSEECADSDNGLNTDTKGLVSYKGVVHVDYCEGEKIMENYCDDGKKGTLEITCINGCDNGRCIK